MKCAAIFTVLLSTVLSFTYAASLQARGKVTDFEGIELTNLDLPPGYHIIATTATPNHESFTLYTNTTAVASIDFDDETGLYFIHDGEGNEVDVEKLEELGRHLDKREIEERGVPFLIAALIGAALRIVIRRFGQRVVTWAYCINIKYVIPCADRFIGCSASGTPPWKCAAGIVCMTTRGLGKSALGRC